MNIAIWGTKKEALFLLKQVKLDQCNTIKCFIDNDSSKWGQYIEEIPICSLDQFKKSYLHTVEAVILAIRNGHSIACVLQQLEKLDIKKIGLLKPSAYDFSENIGIDNVRDSQVIWVNKVSKPLFPYFQVILIKTCNLNCKGCTHFANLFNKEPDDLNTYPIDDFRKDMQIVAENAEVFRLRLLGGEPLLYPNLEEALEIVHEYFPNSDLRIVTNGLLLLKASNKLFQCLRKCNVGVDISPYKPTIKVKDKIIAKLQEFDINYDFEGFENGSIETFAKNVNLYKRNDPERSMKKCYALQCQTLVQGNIYKCPFEALSYKFFQYFHINHAPDYGYDIRDKKLDWKEMINKLQNDPVKACEFCSENIEYFDWNLELNPKCTDWMVK